MRSLIVTAANDSFMLLLQGLVESLHQWESRPFSELACFDLGLGPENRDWISKYAAHVVEPGWDLPVPESRRREAPGLRALTVRPFLPRYFPGYDVYLWIDADAWVQERFAIEWLLSAADQGGLAAVPEVHHAYRQTSRVVNWRVSRMQACFGREAASRVFWQTYFNAGVFALRSDAAHWDHWANSFRTGLEAVQGAFCSDQTSLNHAVWTERLPVSPLPALCNWLCHLALPGFDPQRERFCEPAMPGHPIGILHLTANSKDHTFELRRGDQVRTLNLHFAADRSARRQTDG